MPQHEPTPPDELELRYQKIDELISEGFGKTHIVAWARENADWGVSDRQVRNYIDVVYKRMSTGASRIDRPMESVKTAKQLDFMIEYSMRIKDFKTAMIGIGYKIKLQKLDDPQYEMNWQEVAAKMGKPAAADKIKQLGVQLSKVLDNDDAIAQFLN